MKVAIVHDWLAASGGAEQVVEQILLCYPEADVFSLVDFMPEVEREFLRGRKVTTSFIQKLPFARKHFRYYLTLMPRAVESFDLRKYDLVVSSSWAFAKGVRTLPSQNHVSYVYTPIRYVWDMQEVYLDRALGNFFLKGFARYMLGYLRRWDLKTAQRGGRLIATSHFIAERISQCWQRKSLVLNPPVVLEDLACAGIKDDFYVTVSRLVHYKAVDTLVKAFNLMPDKRLVVVGDGPMFDRLQAMAGPNIELLGYQSRAVVVDYLQRAKAFLFAAHEDFGIVLVEAQACGTPVIAYGKGGALDSVIPFGDHSFGWAPTGLFFQEQTANSVVEAVERFESLGDGAITAQHCVENAARFSPEIFRRDFMAIVNQTLENTAHLASC